jgi:hypothetical protein
MAQICGSADVRSKLRLLCDNGPSYIAGELADYIEAQRISHVRDAPFFYRPRCGSGLNLK